MFEGDQSDEETLVEDLMKYYKQYEKYFYLIEPLTVCLIKYTMMKNTLLYCFDLGASSYITTVIGKPNIK